MSAILILISMPAYQSCHCHSICRCNGEVIEKGTSTLSARHLAQSVPNML